MKNNLKTILKIDEKTKLKYIKNIENYPNLKTVVFSQIFKNDCYYNIELDLTQNSKINTIIFDNNIKLKNDKGYKIIKVEVVSRYVTITYKSEYDIITKSYIIDKNNKKIKLYNEEVTLIKFKYEWINDNTIVIPPCDNINKIDLGKYKINKNTTLDLRNVKDKCFMEICNEINNIIIKLNQNLNIYCYYNNNLTLNIENNKLNSLENENLILKFNDSNKKSFVRIKNSKENNMNIEYGDQIEFESYRNNWCKKITIDNDLTIKDCGYIWDNKNEKITSYEFNKERNYENSIFFRHRYENCKEDVNTLMKVFKRKPGWFYEK